MAEDTVTDYLGHPSQLAEAFERFDLSEARKMVEREPLELSRQIGRSLEELAKRLNRSHRATTAVREHLQQNVDPDEADCAVALLEMAEESDTQTFEVFWKLGGMLMLAMEQADMLEANMVKRSA